jgi:hypothetical protein
LNRSQYLGVKPGRIPFCILLALVLGGCSFQGLNFVQDDRVSITSPEDRAKVELPFELSWEARDFEITGQDGGQRKDAGYFGVFVDRSPPRPGETVDVLLEDELKGDAACRRDPNCPDAAYMAGLGIHTTDETRLTIERLEDLYPHSDRREIHVATIVLLDGKGRRIGESAFLVEFEVTRGA